MRIISRRALREFWQVEKAAEQPLDDWYRLVKKAEWQNLTQVRTIFPHADLVGKCIVFNIGGNKYRLITKINFEKQIIYIRFVLTHKEYDKDYWKTDC